MSVAEHGERVAHHPAVLHVRQRDQVFGTELRGDSQPPVGRKADVEDTGGIVQAVALDDHLPRRVDDRDFGFGRRPERPRQRDRCACSRRRRRRARAPGSWRRGPAARRFTSCPEARSTTEISLLIRFATYRKRPARSDTAAFGSNPAGRVRTTVSDAVSISETVSLQEFATYRPLAVRREREAFRNAAHRDAPDDRARARCRRRPPRRFPRKGRTGARRPARRRLRSAKGSVPRRVRGGREHRHERQRSESADSSARLLLRNRDDAVDRHILQHLNGAARPRDRQPVDFRRRSRVRSEREGRPARDSPSPRRARASAAGRPPATSTRAPMPSRLLLRPTSRIEIQWPAAGEVLCRRKAGAPRFTMKQSTRPSLS